jgi:Fe-Mn family superoxide dismutase
MKSTMKLFAFSAFLFVWCTSFLCCTDQQNLTPIHELNSSTFPFQLPQLPYQYESLEPIMDTETVHLHHDKHHEAYVANLNKALSGSNYEGRTLGALMVHALSLPEAIRNNAGGHWNHAFFWNILTDNPRKRVMPERLQKVLISNFGTVAAFKEEFQQKGLKRLGSGWVWLIKRPDGTLFIDSTLNQDSPQMEGSHCFGQPILTCDLWEHAYYLKYKNKRGSFLENFWHLVNWELVDRLYHQQ